MTGGEWGGRGEDKGRQGVTTREPLHQPKPITKSPALWQRGKKRDMGPRALAQPGPRKISLKGEKQKEAAGG